MDKGTDISSHTKKQIQNGTYSQRLLQGFVIPPVDPPVAPLHCKKMTVSGYHVTLLPKVLRRWEVVYQPVQFHVHKCHR